MADRLSGYRRKRDFAATPEPSAGHARATGKSSAAHFVVHLHHARSRHFDFRLQVGDSLRSWAVPKGPSLDPRHKRLAVQVEDHPLKYGQFEGQIPRGQYGAGQVWIWDEGDWSPEGDPQKALKSGHLRFTLHGHRLHGAWSLIRTRLSGKQPQWLLIKSHDEAERRGDEADDVPLSVWSGNGGTTQSELQRTPHSRRKSSRAARSRSRPKAARSSTRLPARIDLQLARLVEAAPDGKEWLHEIKFDGYRILIWREGQTVRITSRGEQDWSAKLPATADATRRLSCDSCILDGELVTLDEEGRSRFGQLQRVFGQSDGEKKMRAMIFDVLWLDGQDLRHEPQLERKNALGTLLRKAAAPLHLTEYVIGNGAASVQAACEHGLEGIVSKKADAAYAGGRGGAWLKTKCVQSDEYAIVGYTRGQGARERLGSLLLASPAGDGRWRYRGRVGTGLPERTIGNLLKRLKRAAEPPKLEHAPQRAQLRGATPIWVAPQNVVEVEFRGYTEDGLLRQGSLKGLREDRKVQSLKPSQRDKAQVRSPVRPASKAADAARRKPAKPRVAAALEVAQVRLTHPERILFKDPRITKEELATFYRDIAGFILPGLINRPQMLLRCPDGADGECFFQKHIGRSFPKAVHEVADKASRQKWIYIDDLAGLLSLVQMNALEYHVWGCTVEDLEHADRIVMDLDPGEGVAWKHMIEAAHTLREQLSARKLESFVRTSGGKGLHVVIPLNPAADWDAVGSFARALADGLAATQPERYLAVNSKAKRPGKIFIDYLRNGRGSTAVCSYSLRNRAGAPIATPLTWDELPKVRGGDQFRFDNIRRRLSRLSADPWTGIERVKQALPRSGG